MKSFAAALAACLLGLSACVVPSSAAEKPVPPTPAPIKGIVAARPFRLEVPFAYTWSKDRVMVSAGTLVVLDVDPALVVPRDTLEPVLYAGDVPVQRLNHGNKSGRVIGLVPGDVDVTSVPIWFGTPELPGRVTAAMAREERARAEKAGVANTPRLPAPSSEWPPSTPRAA